MDYPTYASLRALGYSGSLNDMLYAFFLADGGSGTTRPARELSWLGNKGYTATTLSGRKAAYIGSNLPVYGPELITNGTFALNTNDWYTFQSTLAATGGELVITATAADLSQAIIDVPTVSGSNYRAEVYLRLGTNPGTIRPGLYDGVAQTLYSTQSTTTMTLHTFNFQAKGAICNLKITAFTTVIGQTSIVDNVSVKLMTYP